MKDQFKTIYHYISIIRCRVSKFPRDKILLRAKRFETRHDFIVSFFLYRLTLSFEDVGSILYIFFFSIYIYASFLVLAFFFSSLSIHRLIANFFFFFFLKKERFAGILSLMKSGIVDMQKFVLILFSLLFNTTFTQHETTFCQMIVKEKKEKKALKSE